MKRRLAALLCTLLALTLSACGGSRDNGSSTNTNAVSTGGELPLPSGTVSLEGRSFPELREGECAVYLDDNFMAIQVRSPRVLLLEDGKYDEAKLKIYTQETAYYYEINFYNGDMRLSIGPSDSNEYEGVRDERLPSMTYRQQGDLLTFAANHSPATADEMLAAYVWTKNDTSNDGNDVEGRYYTRDNAHIELDNGENIPGEANLYVIDLRDAAKQVATIDTYLSTGVPSPGEDGPRFFVDGDFSALQYKGAMVQQLTEVGSIVDGLILSVDFDGRSFYTDIAVTESGGGYTAEILPPEWAQQNPPVGRVHCQVVGDTITIFPDSWELQVADYNREGNPPLNEVSIKVTPTTTAEDRLSPAGGFIEVADNHVWLQLSMGAPGSYDSVQVLRADSEHGSYNVLDTITGEKIVYIDHNVAGDGYHYAFRGVKDGKLGLFQRLETIEDNGTRWYKGGGVYARERIAADGGFGGFILYNADGTIKQDFSGAVDEDYEGEWDYRLVMYNDFGATVYQSEALVNISDAALSYSLDTQHTQYITDGNDIEIKGGDSGSFTRCN